MANSSGGGFGAAHFVGGFVLIFVVLFFVLLPYYLGPNDLQPCGEKPDNNHLNSVCHQSDAIVSISGGDTKARTEEAIKLYKNGWANKLIFSGAAQDKTGPSNAEAMKKQAISEGVPGTDILLEENAVNTQENAVNTQALIQNNNLHSIILVTSAYHQKRASLEFQKRAGKAVEVINHPVAHDRQWQQNWYLTPSGLWLSVSELVKVIGFYASGS